MKKLFLTLALAFVGIFSANAQLWIGGSTNGAFNKEMNRFEIAPEIGYSFKGAPLTIALGAHYGFMQEKLTGANLTANYITLSPYLRYSICNIEKFGLFLDLTGDFGLRDCEGFRVGLQPGIAWMPTKHWTAAFRWGFIGYNNLEGFELLNGGASIYGDKGFTFGFAAAAPTFGLYYNF